jgi:hypothetical protein
MEYTLQQVYDCAIFELAIRAFDIQSGWRDAYERHRQYEKRSFHGETQPVKVQSKTARSQQVFRLHSN